LLDRSEPAPRIEVALRTVGLRGAAAAEVFFDITSSVAVHLSILNVDARGQVGFIWTSETHERYDLAAPVAPDAAVTLPPDDRAGAAGFRIDASSEVEHFFVIPTRQPLDASTRAEIESSVKRIADEAIGDRSSAVPEILAWLDARYPGTSHVAWRKGS
jgi:hypothetical protein